MFKDLKDILDKNITVPKNDKRYSSPAGTITIHDFNFLELIEKWEQIIGPLVYKHTRPLKLNKKRLVIVTNHPAFSQQLSFLKDEILKKMKREFPSLGSINDISFETNTELFNVQSQLVNKKVESSTAPKLHTLSPQYQALKTEAIAVVKKYYGDHEFEEVFIEIYLQILINDLL